MTTNNDEIIQRRKQADKQMSAAEEAVDLAHAAISRVKRDCEHPNAVSGSHQGESCRHCHDCGEHDL